jgi:outer membrane protein OmpA-like peptidoglycan-associated protein
VANRVQQVSIPAPVAELVAAWNDRSADRFVAIMAPDVHVAVPPLHLELDGRDEVWVGVARLFASFGALRYTSRHRYLTPDSVTDEALLEGLQTQEFLGAPPPGHPGSIAARVIMQHDGLVITRLEVWPDVAALRDLSDGVARRIDLRTAGPAAPVVAALRATIPAPEGKLSLGHERQQAPTVAPGTLLPGAPEWVHTSGASGASGAAAGAAAGAGRSDVEEHGKGKPKVEVPKAPVPRKVRRLRAFLAGLVMLVVAGLLVTYVVTGVRDKRLPDATASSKPSPAAQASRASTAKPTPTPSETASATRPTFDRATNTYKFPNKVLFEPDQSTLRPEARVALNTVIRALKDQKRYGILVVTGYTDDTGPTSYNLLLSQQRARVVGNYLTKNLDDARFPVEIRGLGELHPAFPNTSAANREKNRRVEIKVPEPTTGQ